MSKKRVDSPALKRSAVAVVLLFLGIIALGVATRPWQTAVAQAQNQRSYAPVVLGMDQGAVPTATPTLPPGTTATATQVSQPSPSATATTTSTPTATSTVTPSATPTQTPTATQTPTSTYTPEPSETPEDTATPEPSETPEVTETPEMTSTAEGTETPTSTPTETMEPSATPDLPPGEEVLVFDWNEELKKSDSGFSPNVPPLANGNWISPTNFADGTLYYRIELRSMPVPQNKMRLGFCMWQGQDRENCSGVVFKFVPDTVIYSSTAIDDMWKKDGLPILWDEPRKRASILVKNGKNQPVSAKQGWNWSGEDPDEWYPMDIRFTVVAVEEGAGFSGWDNYIP